MSKQWWRIAQGVCATCGELFWTEEENSERYLTIGWQLENHCADCNTPLIKTSSWNEEATDKQINYLKHLGYRDVSKKYTKGTARELISLKVGER